MNTAERKSVRKFLMHSVVFLALGLPVFYGLHECFYWKVRTPIPEVLYQVLDTAKEVHPYSAMVVGDSVAHQFFGPDIQAADTKYAYLASNAATTMLGHYVICREYMERNPVEDIVILMHPYSLMDDLNREYTANYVVGTLWRKEYRGYISPDSEAKIKNTRWWWLPVVLRRFPEFCTLNYQNVNPKPFDEEFYLSPTTVEYLRKLAAFAGETGAEVHVVSPPLPAWLKEGDYSFLQQQIAEEGLEDLFRGYFPLDFVPDDWFADELHLHHHRVEPYRPTLLSRFP